MLQLSGWLLEAAVWKSPQSVCCSHTGAYTRARGRAFGCGWCPPSSPTSASFVTCEFPGRILRARYTCEGYSHVMIGICAVSCWWGTRPMLPSRLLRSPHECIVLYESRPRMHGARRTTQDTSDRYIIALHRTGMGSGLGTGDGAGVGSGEGTGAGAGVGSGQGTGAGAGVGSGEGTGHETA